MAKRKQWGNAAVKAALKNGLKVSTGVKKKSTKKEYLFGVKPMGKPRQSSSDRWKKRPVVMRYRAYADELRLTAKQLGYELESTLNITFVVPYPKSYLTKKGNLVKSKKHLVPGTPHQLKPDIDNMAKAFMDALAKDDRFVHTLNARKVWGMEGKIIVYKSSDNNG